MIDQGATIEDPAAESASRKDGSPGNNSQSSFSAVTAALIRHGDKVLIARRYGIKPRGGSWEFPGGSLEKGENLEECIKREIFEETGLRISVGELIGIVKHQYTDIGIDLYLFDCKLKDGTIDTLEGRENDIRWVPMKDLESSQLCSADRKFLPHIFAFEKENRTNHTSGKGRAGKNL